jgi:hypothetical protein
MIRNFFESIDDGARNVIKDFNFSISGVVVNSDNLKDGFIDVQPITNYLDYSMNEIEYPVIHNVPVIFPSTMSTSFTFPVNQGDGVLLIFTQSSNKDYISGLKETHLPLSQSWLSLNHAVAFIGFNPSNESPFNANNYKNKIDEKNVNIVHNKKTENEILLSLQSDGNVLLKTSKTIYTESKEVNVKADTVNANSALIKTDNDVEIKGLSVYKNMTQHTHKYTDDGNPMVTNKPNIVG